MKENKVTTKTKKNIRVICLFLISLIFVSIAASVALVGCNYIENRKFKETFYSVSSLKVNNKIRIIQLSDLHNCSYGQDNSELIERVKQLKPDLILCTGDMVDVAKEPDDVVRLCEALAEIAPAYYIYGNNEAEKYYDTELTQEALDKKFGFDDSNRQPEKLLEMTDTLDEQLEAVGMKVLKNEVETLMVGTTPVDVYGVLTSNPSSFWSYAGESYDAYMFNNEDHLKIMAIHEPLLLSEYEPESWGDVVFAGHTHGGGIRVPILGPLYVPEVGFFPEKSGNYAYGRHEVQGRPLIVSAGLENKALFRLNNPPELVIVDINKF